MHFTSHNDLVKSLIQKVFDRLLFFGLHNEIRNFL
jgi:hypothetical protein